MLLLFVCSHKNQNIILFLDLEILFVIPKPWGDEDQSFLKIIGCNNTPIVWRDVSWETAKARLEKYMNPEVFGILFAVTFCDLKTVDYRSLFYFISPY